MKKLKLIPLLLVGLLAGWTASAQSADGGLPWSVTEQIPSVYLENVPVSQLATPNYQAAIKEDLDPNSGSNNPYRIALGVDADLSLNNTGKVIYLDNGSKIWTTKIKVDGALAMSLEYDDFYLPKGVSFYLKNENGKQIEGAITSDYNPQDRIYSTTFMEGTTTTLELDIPADVELSEIGLHINKVWAGYRGGIINSVARNYGNENEITFGAENRPLADASDSCEVNAICAPWGQDYHDIKSTVAFIIAGGGVCSGNLMNNTAADCKPLFLTASHCDPPNSFVSSHFSTWQFYFDYEYAGCSMRDATPNTSKHLTGATFRARAPYNVNSNSMVGDFLLLELNDPSNKLGNNYGAYLAGWDRKTTVTPGKHIDFSHPAGDPKKVTVFGKVTPNGNFNGGAPNSHWMASQLEVGGIEGGSSGSGLFSTSTRRLIGDLSGGPELASPCDISPSIHNYSVFSKINLNWEYTSQGNGTAQQRLKDWLDPFATNAMSTETVKKAKTGEPCPTTGETGIEDLNNKGGNEDLNNSIKVFPNPSSDGMVNVRFNLSNAQDIQIEVFNIMGQKVNVFSSRSVISGTMRLDLTNLTAGSYLLRFIAGNNVTSKKIIITK